jgi:uncharacterized membrane protein
VNDVGKGMTATLGPRVATRLSAIDALRGAVMVIMALDHTREFFHASAMVFQPTDLSRTTFLLFFTRWITHFCAPVFVFLAGTGAFLWLEREGSKARLSRFLLTRGLWLVLIEITVMRLAINFSVGPPYPVLLLVLSAIGLSMAAMAALVHLPLRLLAMLSVAVIVLHNTLDGIRANEFGGFAWLWTLLHQPGAFILAGAPVVVGYPVLPWLGVMAAGFCFGQTFRLGPERRQRVLVWTGALLIVAFVAIRFVNFYGDPAPWAPQATGLFTALSFLNTTKYPPSLEFLLMTLGPALLALACLDRRPPGRDHPLVIIGRVPFFYYVVHFWAIHVLSSVMSALRYGSRSLAFLFSPLPSMGGSRELFPADFGYSLWVVYLVWVGIVMSVYPLCRWFARVKAEGKSGWLSYL